MFIQVPFFSNPDEWHCVHAAMRSITNFFLKKDFSLDYLNAMLNPEHNLWVWPSQVVSVLDELGLFVRLFADIDSRVFLDESLLSSAFPSVYADFTHFQSVKSAHEHVIANGLFERRTFSLKDIESAINDNHLPLIILGSKKRLGKYALITGFDDESIYYHDAGTPHQVISKSRFNELWSRPPSNNAVIIVYGKKYEGSFVKF